MSPEVFRTPDERFTALGEWQFEPHYLDVGGLRLHYVDEGPEDAGVFLLTHGEPTWGYLYRKWIPRLVEAGYRVIVPDHIGFGRSDKVLDEEWYVIERHVEMQRALIDGLDLRHINLFCQDWGGPISLRNACDQPERYERLFIANTWLHHDGYEYTDAIRTWRAMAVDPGRLGGDMPTGMLVGGAMRRDGHDKAALTAAYDAPYVGSPSKPAPVDSPGACRSCSLRRVVPNRSNAATSSCDRGPGPSTSSGGIPTACSLGSGPSSGHLRSPGRPSIASPAPATSCRRTRRRTASTPSSGGCRADGHRLTGTCAVRPATAR